MELQTLGARILSALLFISILLIATAEAARNGTTAVSHNNNGTKAASANKGRTVFGEREVSRYDYGTTPVPANKGKTSIRKTRVSANHGKTAIGGKTKGSANHGKKVASANHGKSRKTAIGGKTKWSANHGKRKVYANHGKTAGSRNNNVRKAVFTNKVSANHGKTAVFHNNNNNGTKPVSTNNGKRKVTANHGKKAVSQKYDGIKAVSTTNGMSGDNNNGATSAPKKQQQQPEQFSPEFNWEQQQYLKAHNDLRRKNGIPPLEWDAGLAAYARSWAMERRKDCKYRNHSNGTHGENSFWMQYKDFNPTDVVQNWFSEEKLFDHARNLCKCKVENEECECGHYLNLIGRTTTKVGCSGYVYCADEKGVIVYCSYDPPTHYNPGLISLNPQNPLARRLLSFI